MSQGEAKVKEREEEKLAEGKNETETPSPEKVAEGTVEGTVATAAGPLANAKVFLAELNTTTDAYGKFVLEHLPVGNVALQVTSPTSRFENSTVRVTVEKDKKANLFVFLAEASGTVEGDVTDEKGKPLAAAQVSGLFRALDGTVAVKVDEKGHYSFKNVPPGAHFIRASAPGFMIEGKSVGVVGSGLTTCSFALKRGALSLSGRVTDPEGLGVNAEVYLLKGGIVVTRAYTKAGDGSYAFGDLAPGNYEVTIVASNFAPKGWMGKLEKDEVVDFKLEARPLPEPSPDPSARFA